jgi:hypothetical protein
MPEPWDLRLHRLSGRCVVMVGGTALMEYAEADTVMRNFAIMVLRQARFSGERVSEVFGLTPAYVSTLRAAAVWGGSAALIRHDRPGWPPKLAGARLEQAGTWRTQGAATTRSGGGWAWSALRSAVAWGRGPVPGTRRRSSQDSRTHPRRARRWSARKKPRRPARRQPTPARSRG